MSVVTLRGRLICADGNEADIVACYLDRHVELTRAESGCLHFSVEPTADPLVWMVSERFVDKHAFDSHQARVRVSDWGRVTEGIMREYTIDYGADS